MGYANFYLNTDRKALPSAPASAVIPTLGVLLAGVLVYLVARQRSAVAAA